ncbi:hypothetical protein SNE40_011479 [Patella caerulea]|uniref:F-box domain-containing protein n=1 Tax=Patella caerulea TaxID=87958 RepID=A0AAN8JMS7_PATCE
MAAGTNWAGLPSVIIVDIVSYLSLEDRLKSSSICKRWRSCLFHPTLWQNVLFSFDKKDRKKSNFLAANCGRFIREAVVKFNSRDATEVRECAKLLDILSKNKNLERFSLQPSSCHIVWSEQETEHIIDNYLDNIEELIRNARRLSHFSLGCVEELLVHSNSLVQLMVQHHSKNLKSLHLASVKEDSEHYGIIEFDTSLICSFQCLTKLSIDYDYLTNELLHNFTDIRKAKLEKLCIHIHGISPEHEIVTNATWRRLRNYSPSFEVTVNLTHSHHGVAALLDVLQPCMPLTHFRQYFCSHINVAAIDFISTHFNDTLKTVIIMDDIQDQPMLYDERTDVYPDPFVMLAWRCIELQELSIIGYGIADGDVIAIARLRGDTLKKLVVPLSCIYTSNDSEDDASEIIPVRCISDDFFDKVSKSLNRSWWPVDDHELPEAVFDHMADAEDAYMETLLDDQKA